MSPPENASLPGCSILWQKKVAPGIKLSPQLRSSSVTETAELLSALSPVRVASEVVMLGNVCGLRLGCLAKLPPPSARGRGSQPPVHTRLPLAF